MRKLFLAAAIAAALASSAAFAAPARAAESPFVRLGNAVNACVAERQADAGAFRSKYGVGRFRLNALLRCVVFNLRAPAPVPVPDPDEEPTPDPGGGF